MERSKSTIRRICRVVVTCLVIFTLCYFIGYGIGKMIGNMEKITYPETAREGVVENYHGTEVADPYRWLEDDMSERTAEWVKAQNEVTLGYLNALPQREAIRERLTELWNYPSQSAPS